MAPTATTALRLTFCMSHPRPYHDQLVRSGAIAGKAKLNLLATSLAPLRWGYPRGSLGPKPLIQAFARSLMDCSMSEISWIRLNRGGCPLVAHCNSMQFDRQPGL